MKEDWKYSKLGDICDLYQPKTISGDMLVEDGEYLVYGANGIIGRYDKYNHEESEVLLTCRGATCGSINISEPYSWINGNAMVVHPSNEKELRKDFIRYYLASVDWSKVITGAAQPQITRQSLSPLQVACPPLPEQESIVSELDCLSSVIEKQKQQLKELDNLAQSIFYTTFGDPISNNFGWDIKLLGEVCEELFAGGDKPKDTCETKTDVYQYPIYANGDGDRGLLGYSKTYRVKKPAVTLGARGASVGNCRICEGCFTPVVRLITMVPSDLIDITYLYYSIRLLKFNVSGAGQAQLTTPNVINKEIPLPPLYLQEEFASKVAAIEKQKEIIKQSIEETETLFNSRMDYYFN